LQFLKNQYGVPIFSKVLEPCAGKLARTVLRGLGAGDSPRLPGVLIKKAEPEMTPLLSNTTVFSYAITNYVGDGLGAQVCAGPSNSIISSSE
jgi:hypothetical protein